MRKSDDHRALPKCSTSWVYKLLPPIGGPLLSFWEATIVKVCNTKCSASENRRLIEQYLTFGQ